MKITVKNKTKRSHINIGKLYVHNYEVNKDNPKIFMLAQTGIDVYNMISLNNGYRYHLDWNSKQEATEGFVQFSGTVILEQD